MTRARMARGPGHMRSNRNDSHLKAEALEAFVADIFVSAGCSTDEGGRIGRYLVSANLVGPRQPRRGARAALCHAEEERHRRGRRHGRRRGRHAGDRGGRRQVRLRPDGDAAGGPHRHRQMQEERPLRRDPAQRGPCRPGRRLGGDGGGRRAWCRSISSMPRAACWWRRSAASTAASRPRPTASASRGRAQDPLVLDFATSIVAEGKVLVASQGGKKVPDGALIGPDGSRAPIRICSTATTRRPARAITRRAPARSAPSAITRARASPSCARCWAARSRATARPIPSAASSPTACCRSTSIRRCSIRRASSPRTSRDMWPS